MGFDTVSETCSIQILSSYSSWIPGKPPRYISHPSVCETYQQILSNQDNTTMEEYVTLSARIRIVLTQVEFFFIFSALFTVSKELITKVLAHCGE